MIHATSLPSCVELFLHFLSEENAKIGIFTLHSKEIFFLLSSDDLIVSQMY